MIVTALIISGLYLLGAKQASILLSNELVVIEDMIANGVLDQEDVVTPNKHVVTWGWPYYALRSIVTDPTVVEVG